LECQGRAAARSRDPFLGDASELLRAVNVVHLSDDRLEEAPVRFCHEVRIPSPRLAPCQRTMAALKLRIVPEPLDRHDPGRDFARRHNRAARGRAPVGDREHETRMRSMASMARMGLHRDRWHVWHVWVRTEIDGTYGTYGIDASAMGSMRSMAGRDRRVPSPAIAYAGGLCQDPMDYLTTPADGRSRGRPVGRTDTRPGGVHVCVRVATSAAAALHRCSRRDGAPRIGTRDLPKSCHLVPTARDGVTGLGYDIPGETSKRLAYSVTTPCSPKIVSSSRSLSASPEVEVIQRTRLLADSGAGPHAGPLAIACS